MRQKDLILYAGLIILGLAAPFIFPGFKVQLTILCVLIVLATTWNLQGGEMGYNSFGNHDAASKRAEAASQSTTFHHALR